MATRARGMAYRAVLSSLAHIGSAPGRVRLPLSPARHSQTPRQKEAARVRVRPEKRRTGNSGTYGPPSARATRIPASPALTNPHPRKFVQMKILLNPEEFAGNATAQFPLALPR